MNIIIVLVKYEGLLIKKKKRKKFRLSIRKDLLIEFLTTVRQFKKKNNNYNEVLRGKTCPFKLS